MIDGSKPLKNAHHEVFAQNLAQGMSVAEAYTEAGYKAGGHSAEVAGGRLLRNVEVQTRIAWLQRQAAERTVTTIETITAEFEVARVLARENGNPAAMVSATMGKARVNGLLVNKHLVGLKRLEEMNGEELRALLGLEGLPDEEIADRLSTHP